MLQFPLCSFLLIHLEYLHLFPIVKLPGTVIAPPGGLERIHARFLKRAFVDQDSPTRHTAGPQFGAYRNRAWDPHSGDLCCNQSPSSLRVRSRSAIPPGRHHT
jgi:hypothetical protein